MSKGNQRCENCRFWVDVGITRRQAVDPGRCRAHPPTVVLDGVSFFIDTPPDSWCGEWQAETPTYQDQACIAMARQVLAGDMAAARALADRIMELPVIPTEDGK